jgi:YhcH/YjgK/YiaL family protein
MIAGSIKQAQLTGFLNAVPVLQRSLEWIRRLPDDASESITELEGRDLYINLHSYRTLAREACRWESHRHTADLQYCLEGGEAIDWTPLQPEGLGASYDPAKDFETWSLDCPRCETVHLEAGRFVLFLPGELHRPVIADGRHSRIRKAVVKIHARFLPVV